MSLCLRVCVCVCACVCVCVCVRVYTCVCAFDSRIEHTQQGRALLNHLNYCNFLGSCFHGHMLSQPRTQPLAQTQGRNTVKSLVQMHVSNEHGEPVCANSNTGGSNALHTSGLFGIATFSSCVTSGRVQVEHAVTA